jgi:hypothetical protein
MTVYCNVTTNGSDLYRHWVTSSTSTVLLRDLQWDTWCRLSQATTTTNSMTWNAWVHDDRYRAALHQLAHMCDQANQQAWQQQVAQQKETPAEKKERLEKEEQRRKWQDFWICLANVFARAFEDEAKKKAHKLLIECLTPEQKATYEKDRYFTVEAAGRVFRIEHGTHGNVKELGKDGRPAFSWCIQPGGVPTEDAMLAQKLWLEANPEEFMRVGNKTPFYR